MTILTNFASRVAWALHRMNVDRLQHVRPFSPLGNRRRLLLVTERHRISQSQIFPFFFYRRELFEKFRIEFREISSVDYMRRFDDAPGRADIVCLQTKFDIAGSRLKDMLSVIRDRSPDAKIVYLDSFAPLDLHLADVVNDQVDLYVKKHVFRDRAQYLRPTMGDTNLADYYGHLYGLDLKAHTHVIPDGFLRKLVVGPSFFTSIELWPYISTHSSPSVLPKTLDVHGRLSFKGSDWYQRMREHAIRAMDGLQDVTAISSAGVGRREYMRELRSSRLCFSPFGYGEVSWRDYEAIMCGSVLVKPDMSHVEVDPDIFIPYKTYVPMQWDFSDFPEKVHSCLKNEGARREIAARAYQVLHDYALSQRFLEQMKPVLSG